MRECEVRVMLDYTHDCRSDAKELRKKFVSHFRCYNPVTHPRASKTNAIKRETL